MVSKPSAAEPAAEESGIISHVRQFIELTEEKRRLEAELKDLNGSLEDMEPDIAEWMLANGMQSMNVDGHCVYKQVSTSVTVIAGRQPQAVEAAFHLGLEDMVVLQPARLASYAKEMLNDVNGRIPEELDAHLKKFERVSVRVRKS